MIPAQAGAFMPSKKVQARISIGPAVKKVLNLRISYEFLTKRSKPLSSTPKSLRNASFSSSSNEDKSSSTLALTGMTRHSLSCAYCFTA